MKPARPIFKAARRRAFTLVEMLISVALLSLLVLVLMGVMISASTTVNSSWAQLQSDEDARLVLDRLQIDLQNMLIRPDIDYEFIQATGGSGPGNGQNDQLCFYASEPGFTSVTSGKRVASVINYLMAAAANGQPILERGSNDGFQWAGSGSGISTVPAMIFDSSPQLNIVNASTIGSLVATAPNDPPDILSTTVFRFELGFLLKNPTNVAPPNQSAPALVSALPTNTSITNVAAIVVTIATIDSQNAKIVPTSAWNKLVAALPDSTGTPSSPGTSTALAWKNLINTPAFATTAGIPAKAAAAVRVYDRYFYLSAAP